MASSHNMSSRQGAKFGMRNLKRRAETVVTSTKQCDGIKSKHLHFAKIEQKVYLQSIGRNPAAYLSSSSSESDDDDDDDVVGTDEASREQGDLNRPEEPPAHAKSNVSEQLPNTTERETTPAKLSLAVQMENTPRQLDQKGKESNSSDTLDPTEQLRANGRGEKMPSLPDVNSVVVLDILRELDWNWYSFVLLLESKFERQGYSQEVLDQFLVDFASQLPNLGLKDDELQLTEQSRAAYLSDVMQKEVRIQEIVEQENSDDEGAHSNGD